MCSVRMLSAVLFLLAFQCSTASVAAPECKTFDEIYKSGKELCENMWDGAFKYETNEKNAYTMWFFDEANPNDAVAKDLGKLTTESHEKCHLSYFHKDVPGPEPDAFTECHPWKENACCAQQTVLNAQKLKEGYGPEYHWDRCGPLSSECERFFVQEACFYECDPNAGLYRKWHPSVYDENNEDHNEWQMANMPIKASYCDAWFTACKKDKFCASGGGSYFSCAAEYEQVDIAALQAELQLAKEQAALNAEEDDGLGTGPIVGFIAGGTLILALLLCGCFLIMKERAGKPVFGSLLESQPAGGGQSVGNSQM